MTTPADWVIGRGLLGSAILAELDPRPVFTSIVRWVSPEDALADLISAADKFFSPTGDRTIYWSAGRGVTSTPAAQLAQEVDVFRGFLDALPEAASARTTLFLASSVGGVYGRSTDPPFTEETTVSAASAYGEAKLAMELIAAEWARRTGARLFIGRMTNIYGPGQDLRKAQGLISIVLRSYVTATPATIYVSLDTLRDYIYVGDCARVVVAGTKRMQESAAGSATVKIIGSGTVVSIGAVLGETYRLRRAAAPIVLGQGDAAGQASDLRVKSTTWTDLDALARTTLPAGIHATYLSMIAAHARGG